MIETKKFFSKALAILITAMIVLTGFVPALSFRTYAEQAVVTETTSQKIENFGVFLVSGADNNGTLAQPDFVWTPGSTDEGHQFKYQLDYTFSGEGELVPGTVRITLPKHILKDRNGEIADNWEVAIPEADQVSESDTENQFVFMEQEDSIIIYNRMTLSAAEKGSIQFGYSTSKSIFEYEDMILSLSVPVELNINKSADERLYTTAQIPQVKINTTATLTKATKTFSQFFDSWQDDWGDPAYYDITNSDDYYYLLWLVTSVSNATQPFVLTFNDTVTGDYGDASLVGAKMYGNVGYSTEMTSNPIRSSGHNMYSYVITKHLKETYNPYITYQIRNKINVVLHPIDNIDADSSIVSSAVYTYSEPKPDYPIGSFNFWKYNNYSYYYNYDKYNSNVMNYQLGEFRENNIPDIHEKMVYKLMMQAYSYPWTIEDGYGKTDVDHYGVNKLTYTITDDVFFFADTVTASHNYETKETEYNVPEGTEQLDFHDYEITKVDYQLRITGARWDTEQLRFVTAAPDYSDDDIVYFYAKFGKDTEWREAGRYYLKTGVGESLNNKVTSVTSTGIIFTDNAQCVGYKIVTSNSYYYTNLEAYPFCKIKHSERIDRLVEEVFSSGERKAWLTNIANVRITKSDNADADLQESVLLNKTEFARNYIIGYEKESEIRKKCTYTHNDKVKHIVTLGWQVDVYENYMTQEGVVYVPQESGVFYDLVPAGAEPDLSTVEVKSDSGYLKPSEIDVSTITNYNDTGRTLLVVKIKKRSERGYTMTYSSLHTWESIYDYGALVRNSVAYETGNDNITNGYPDNGGNITESTLLSELDSKTDAKKFLYAEHSRTINILLVVSAGLTKKVKSDTDGTYQRSTAVRLSQDYTYRIRYQTDFVTRSKNMVLFDNLETFSNPDENIYSRWQGMLKRVDVSQLRAIGADPVVYLSNHTVDINDGVFDLTDTATWKKMEDFGDISMARAVAVDLSKDKNGKDFVLESNKSVTVMLHMTAPSSEPDITLPEEEKIAFAYNDVSISARLMSIYSQTFSDDRFITWNYDSVGLKVMGDIPILKLDDSDHSRPVEGISFRLSGVSAYGTEIDSILESDVNGELTFKDIEKGTYELIEYNGSVDYLKINDTFSVTVRSDGTVAVDGTVLEKGVRYKIYDKPRVHVDVSFNKRNLKNKNRRIEGVQFHLYGTSTYGNNINKYAYSNEKGIVSFEDVEMGRYTLKEVSTTQDYILNDNEYVVRIDENGNYEIEGAHRELDGTYTVYNEPYHHFTIQKEGYIEIGGIVLPVAGAKFNLSGSSYLGTEVNMDKTTGINGQATFDHLEAGRYVLYEVEAPEGYVLNTEKYIVTISEDDNITITGSYKNDSGCFVIKNKENSSVTITKKWVDNETNQTREAEPVIHLGVDSTAPVAYFYGNGTDSVLTELAPSYNLRGFAHYDGDADYVKSMIRSGNAAKIDDGSTKCSIYAWYVSDSSAPDYGTVYWWSDANIVYLTNASHRIFSDISSITTIDLSGIDFSLVTDMSYMFHNCSNLKNISFLENLDLSRVTDMSYMFFGCRVLSEVNISCSGTSQLTNTSYMFSDCYQLTDLDVSDFDTSSVTNMSNMFAGCGLTSLDVSGFDTTNVTNMSGMFAGCGGLTSLNVSAFDTANVTDMSYMFSGCNRLTSLDVSGFDTSNVTDMSYMFSRCNRLTSLDVSGFDTTNVTNMSNMFSGCSGLTSLDVSDFDTTNVTNMSGMFSSCSGLTSLDVTGFNTSNVTNMYDMFSSCSGLTNLDVSGFDTSSVTDMSSMFEQCVRLTSLDLSNFETSKATNMRRMFYNCRYLVNIFVSSGWNTNKVSNSYEMFYNCTSLNNDGKATAYSWSYTDKTYARIYTGSTPGYLRQKTDQEQPIHTEEDAYFVGNGDNSALCLVTDNYKIKAFKPFTGDNDTVQNVINNGTAVRLDDKTTDYKIYAWYVDQSSAEDYGTVYWWSDASNVYLTDKSHRLWWNLSRCIEIDTSGINTSKVTDMSNMFSSCRGLTSLDLNGLDTSSVTNMSRMFSYCNNLTSLDIGRLDISSVTNMSGMFYSCSGMTDFSAISNWNVSGVTDMSGMFSYCSGITDLTCFKDWDTSNVTNMEGMFSFQEGLTDISAIGSWNISKVRNMNNMFTYCSALTDLNGLEHWDTRNVITMYGMFGFCRSLSDIHALADWDTSSVTDMGELFSGYVYGWTNTTANRLENVDALRNWDTSHVSNMARMFDHNYYLKNVDGLKNWDVSGVTNMEGMFTSCKSLTSIDGLKNWDVSGVTNMSRMFESCSSLKSADLSKWNPQSPSANMLFSCCNSLITLDVSNWNVGDNFSMCIGCTSLVYVNVSGWTFSGYAHVDSLFSDCRSLRIIDGIEKWKLTKGNLNRLFNNCSSLTELDLSSWDTHGSAMSHMFYGCSNLKTIYVSGLWTNRYESTYVNDDNMFTGCSSLVGGNGTAYNSNNTNWRFACIDTEDTPGYLTFKGTSIDLLYSSTDSNCIVEKVNDNTWTYTFTGLNPNINYYAWEDELENYTSLNMGKENFLMVIDGQGTITNTVKEDPPSFGNLIINKNVLNKDGSEYISSIDKAKRFHFTIILKDSSGAALTDDLLLKTIKPDGSDGILLFTEGKADFTLADDESLMIMDIPAGYLYKVTEEADDNFITTVAGGAAEDTIEADNIKLVSFINKMNYDESEDVTFTIKKEVTGTGIDPNESYSFAVDFSGLRANGLYAIKVNGVTRKSFSASAERKAFVEFDLKANETASITIPENAAYCITERAGNYTSSYRMTDSAGLDLIVRSADSNTNENTDLSTQTETADRGEKISIVFTNTKNVKQKLTLIKEVENASSGNSDSFDFTVILKGLPAKAVIPTSLGRVTADDGGVITAEFVLTAGGIVEFSELPVGTKYEIIEGESDYVASYIVKYGEEEITQGENESPGKELTTREHSIELYKNPTVTFTNRKVSCDITVTKMVDMTYGNLTKGEYSMHEFKFDIIVTGLQGSGKKYSELKGEFKEKDTTGVVQKSLAEIMDLSGEAANEIADTARFTVTLHHGESFKLKGLPYGATYFVTEQANAAYIASYTVSSNEGALLQTAPDGNTVRNKALSLNTEETVDSDDTDIVFVFNNRYEFIPYELPAAGMSDMRVLFAAVLFCMLVCTAVYVLSSQKKEIKR